MEANTDNISASHVLVVDDNAEIREATSRFLELAGFKVTTAASAKEAIELLKQNVFEVVITDIMMPEMDGLELTSVIKKDYDADVIVITGYTGKYCYEEAINKGASDFIFKPIRPEELLLRLKRVLKEQRIEKERIQILKKLEKLAITDALTKLYNSRHFFKQIEMEVKRSNRYKQPIGLVLLDIDNFKEYNDTYGHIEGDKVLSRIGKIINSLLRTMDTAYRYGGEEFTVLLPQTGGREAKTAAERIRSTIEKEQFFPIPGKNSVSITISAGVTEYCRSEKISDFIRRADRAMYLSKENGKNQVNAIFADTAQVA